MAVSKLNNKNNGKETTTFTSKERQANGRKGGLASGKARRERSKMREGLYHLLSLPMRSGDKKTECEELKALDALDANFDTQTAILLAILRKAIKGDIVAATFIRDTLGENPYIVAEKEKQEAMNKAANSAEVQINAVSDILFKVREKASEVEDDGNKS